METNSEASSKRELKMVEECISINQGLCMKVIGKMIKSQVKVLSHTKINKYTQEGGSMVKSMVTGCTSMQMATSTTACGSRTKRTARG